MTKAEAAAQTQLRAVARELSGIRYRLLGVVASLSGDLPAAVTGGEQDEQASDRVAEVRSVVECVLADDIRPAIDDLLGAARYGSRQRKPR
jgi:hypothetical protein